MGKVLLPFDRIVGCKYALTHSNPLKSMLTEYNIKKPNQVYLKNAQREREIWICLAHAEQVKITKGEPVSHQSVSDV